jgi:hypothetical protein
VDAYEKQIAAIKVIGDDKVALSDALLNRATIALDTKDYDRVRELCSSIIDLNARIGDAWHVLAMLAYRESDHEKAIQLFDIALATGCRNQPLTHWNKSLPLHAIGLYKEGWQEHAWGKEEVTVQAIYIPHHRFTLPEWNGEPAPATIHVHTEAGHGDNIAMLRYLPLLVERGYTVRYECDPLLMSLVKQSMPQIEVVPRAIDYPGALGLKPFDYHIPIGDLPHAFGTDIDTVPWNGPYLNADPRQVARYAEAMRTSRIRKIGLCWSSGIRRNTNIWMEQYGQMKSMHFDDLVPLLATENRFFSLQVGDGQEQHRGWLVDMPENPDWADTAALIANLDLVITVDTGVAHLAGAMGKPVWVMTQRDGTSWHFMCYRDGASWNESSPWYPSARVFRKPSFGDCKWNSVVEDVAKALSEMVPNARL